MRFTKSKDGVERCTVRPCVRLSRTELADIKKAAKAKGQSWRQWLDSAAAMGVETELMDADEEITLRQAGELP